MDYSHLKRQDLVPFFKEMDSNNNDVQGLIRRGYKSLPAAHYLLLKITEGSEAKKYFNDLIRLFITNSDDSNPNASPNNFDKKKSVQIAFSSTGLKEIGLNENILSTFSREFLEGMSFSYTDPDDPGKKIRERSTLLGDVGNSDPGKWHWGNEKDPVDCVLLLYAETKNLLAKLTNDCYDTLKQGVDLVFKAETFLYNPKEDFKEHFGFKDGISKPVIRGYKKSADYEGEDNLLNPGEFILGHKNEYNNYSPSPYFDKNETNDDLDFLPGFNSKKDLGKNGSYLVFRQIEQDIDTFFDYVFHKSKETADSPEKKAIKLAAKMFGRWPEGQSLTVCPDQPCNVKDLNDFRYRAKDEPDDFGVGCPFGAHVRRTNPRDQVHAGRGAEVSLEISKKHRILRRGRIYGEPLDPKLKTESILEKAKSNLFQNKWKADATGKTVLVRGIHFMCLVSDIGRQFEFIQSVWANTSSFGNLGKEVDPIISPRPTRDQQDCHEFSTPQHVVRNRYRNVPEFTTVVGGAYFFMPGIKALKFIMR